MGGDCPCGMYGLQVQRALLRSRVHTHVKMQTSSQYVSPMLIPYGAAQEVKKLCTALAKNTHIKELSLASHAISEESAAALADMLQHNASITSISECCKQPIAASAAFPCRAAHVPSSTLTVLCQCWLAGIGDSTFGDAGQVALCPGIAASSSLTSVDAEQKVWPPLAGRHMRGVLSYGTAHISLR